MRVKENMQQGFTLLELLVVLVIVGMTASFAAPNLWHSYVTSSERASVRTFSEALMHLREQAFHTGRAVRLPATTPATDLNRDGFPPLPEGWELEKSTSLRFLPNGVTNGGSFELRSPVGNLWRLRLAPLDGKVSIQPGGNDVRRQM